MYTSRAGCVNGPPIDGVLAQLGEHLPYKQRVIGSSPIGPIGEAGDGFPVVLLNLIYGEIAQLARAYGSYP